MYTRVLSIPVKAEVSPGVCTPLSPRLLTPHTILYSPALKPGYTIWGGVHRLGDSGVHRLGDTSALVNPADQLLLIAINSGLIAEMMASA